MKKYLLLICFIFLSLSVFSQGKPKVDGIVLIPQGAPANPVEGEIYYSSVDKLLYTYNGIQWVSGGGGANFDYYTEAEWLALTPEEQADAYAVIYGVGGLEGGSGDVVGPASATDNAIARFDGTTGKLVQNSGVTIDDSGNIAVTGSITSGGVAVPTISSTSTLTNKTINALNNTISNIDETNLDTSVNASLDLADGSVQGPASATDNTMPRFDGTTGKLVQGSGIIIDDSNNMDQVNDIIMTGNLWPGNVKSNTSLTNELDDDNNTANATFDILDGADAIIFTVAESGDVTVIGTLTGTVAYDNTISGLASTTVKTAIDELAAGGITVSDVAFGAGWNGDTNPTSKNSIYDEVVKKLNSVTTGEPTGADAISNIVSLTKAEYDAGSPVTGTYYIITDPKTPEVIQVACSDLTSNVTTGTSKAYFRMPWAATLTGVRVSLIDAGTTTGITVDINEGGVSVLSTLLTTDATEATSTTATTAAVISDSALADDAIITIDFDAVPTAGKGVIVTLYVEH